MNLNQKVKAKVMDIPMDMKENRIMKVTVTLLITTQKLNVSYKDI